MICYQFYVLKEFFHLSFWRTCGHYVVRFVLYILCVVITLSPIFFAEVIIKPKPEQDAVETTSLPPKSFWEKFPRTKKAFTFATGGIFEPLMRDREKVGQDRCVTEGIEHADEEIAPPER